MRLIWNSLFYQELSTKKKRCHDHRGRWWTFVDEKVWMAQRPYCRYSFSFWFSRYLTINSILSTFSYISDWSRQFYNNDKNWYQESIDETNENCNFIIDQILLSLQSDVDVHERPFGRSNWKDKVSSTIELQVVTRDVSILDSISNHNERQRKEIDFYLNLKILC